MKLFLYRLVMFLSKPLIGIVLAYRRKKGLEINDSKRALERFGIASVKRPEGKVVWFNAASVGESNSILPIVDEIQKMYPDVFVVVTTSSLTGGQNMGKKLHGKNAVHQFLPVDRRAYVDKFFNYWKPSMGFFVDSDFWPNLILSAAAHSVTLVLLNGRVSNKSFKKYVKNLNFIRPLMQKFEFGFGKSDEDRARLFYMGIDNPVCVGNLKYAVAPLSYDEGELFKLKKEIGDRKVFVVSSTHEGEEELCLDAFKIVKEQFKDSLMIIAPRHPARGEEVANLCKNAGFKSALRSKGEKISLETDVYVANTMGEMGLFYSIAGISFVGGSLIKWGGHNPMEPARLKNVVISGPYVHNFTETFDILTHENAIVMVKDKIELGHKLVELFNDTAMQNKYVDKAYKIAEREASVLGRAMTALEPLLKKVLG